MNNKTLKDVKLVNNETDLITCNANDIIEAHKLKLKLLDSGALQDTIKIPTLSGLDFSGINFEDKDLRYMELSNSKFDGCMFQNTNFENANLNKSSLQRCYFNNCSFDEAKLRETDLSNSIFYNCSFCSTEFNKTDFLDCDIMNTNFAKAHGMAVAFNRSIIKNSYFFATKLEFSNFFHCSILDNDFRRATLNDSCFIDSFINNTTFAEAKMNHCNFKGAKAENNIFFDARLCISTGTSSLDIYDICPEGNIIGYKLLNKDCIAKLSISKDTRRVSGTTRKCRCEKARIVELLTLNGEVYPEESVSISEMGNKVTFKKGKTIKSQFTEDRWIEDGFGIDFYISIRECLKFSNNKLLEQLQKVSDINNSGITIDIS